MRINGKQFESKNEKVIPLIRPNGNIFLIAEAIEDMKALNEKLEVIDKAEKLRTVTSMKPGGKPRIVDNKANRENDRMRFIRWTDAIAVHSLKYITQDEQIEMPMDEPEGGWPDDYPQDLRVFHETRRVKHLIDWETVDFADPMTWGNWRIELRQSKINEAEINRIASGCMEANSLSEQAVEIAMDDFLSLPPVLVGNESGQPDELGSTASGEPAIALASDLPE